MTFKLDRKYHDFILWLSTPGLHTFLILCTLAFWFRDWNSTRRLQEFQQLDELIPKKLRRIGERLTLIIGMTQNG
jgi:hypothetical protein